MDLAEHIVVALVGEEYGFRYPLEVIDMSKHEMKKEEFDKDKADEAYVSQ